MGNVLAALAGQRAVAVLPPETNRPNQRAYARTLYAERNKIERFFGRLKEARGFVTRYEKPLPLLWPQAT